MDPQFVSAAIGAVSGTLVAAVVYWGQRRQARWAATMNLMRESNSLEFQALRREVYELFCRDPSGRSSLDRDVLGGLVEPAERDRMWAR